MLPDSRMLYEQVDLKTLSQKAFSEVIYRADELIMKPLTRYRKDLPDDNQGKIYNDLHSPIAQFTSDPTFPREITPDETEPSV